MRTLCAFVSNEVEAGTVHELATAYSIADGAGLASVGALLLAIAFMLCFLVFLMKEGRSKAMRSQLGLMLNKRAGALLPWPGKDRDEQVAVAGELARNPCPPELIGREVILMDELRTRHRKDWTFWARHS